jgi:glucokinase
MPEPAAVALALDVGGTKLASALVDVNGAIRERRVTATPVTESAVELWDGLASVLPAGGSPVGLVGVGIASAGPLDTAAGTVSPVNIGAWRGFPLAARVRERFPYVPVTLLGDAVAAAVGELATGNGRTARSGLLAVVSTGVGGGLFLDRRVITGPTGNAGHLGHTIVEFDGDACACGARGCVEAYASGPSMVRRALSAGWAPTGGADAAGLADAARTGDAAARAAIETGGRALAAMIASQTAALELDVAILGGGVMQSADVIMPAVRRGLSEYAHLAFVARVSVVTAALGGDAGLVGAGLVAHDPRWLAR